VAAREFGVRILLVGLAPELKRELAKHSHRGLPIEIVPASEVISMEDSPSQASARRRIVRRMWQQSWCAVAKPTDD